MEYGTAVARARQAALRGPLYLPVLAEDVLEDLDAWENALVRDWEALVTLWRTVEPDARFRMSEMFYPEPLYMTLLRPPRHGDRLRRSLMVAREAFQAEEDQDEALLELLNDRDWRRVLVGCVIVLLGYGKVRHTEQMWGRLSSGSWVAPQLAATLSLADPAFDARAKSTLDSPEAFLAPGLSEAGREKVLQALVALMPQHVSAHQPLTHEGRFAADFTRRWLDDLTMGLSKA